MNEECEAVKTTLWAEAPTVGWPPSLHSEIFKVRRPCAPSSHVSNKHTQNPMAGKIKDDRWVRPSHGEASGLRQPWFWITVFLLLDRLPAKANEPVCPHTHTHTHAHMHTHTHTHTRTVPSKSTDQLSLSSMSEMVSVQSDSGRADPWTMITRPGAEVAQRLCLLLMDCTFMLENRDSVVFELGDCFNTQGSPY